MEQRIFSISEVNSYLANRMDADPFLAHIAIRGEISNYKLYPSGHHYFSLKDENSCLKCVLFRANAMRLRFRPENGMKVIAYGKVGVYLRDGVYQLNCSTLVSDGIGDLYTAFEQLKKELHAKGLFDISHKKKLPLYPKKIGIITSSAGAAVHDILRILKKRYPVTEAYVLPVRVQGIEAPEEICAAIQYANRYKVADVLIVGRGGGSIEDLWAFNDKRVAYAIYQSEIPIISAVGHEPDTTISDFVADVRAATPSNAAELAVPDMSALQQRMDDIYLRMSGIISIQINSNRARLAQLSQSSVLRDSSAYMTQQRQVLEHLNTRLVSSALSLLQKKYQRYTQNAAKLDAMSPLKVIGRGYAIVTDANTALVRSVNQVNKDEVLRIKVSDGCIYAAVRNTEEDQHEQ